MTTAVATVLALAVPSCLADGGQADQPTGVARVGQTQPTCKSERVCHEPKFRRGIVSGGVLEVHWLHQPSEMVQPQFGHVCCSCHSH
jgi:hypothetical protein